MATCGCPCSSPIRFKPLDKRCDDGIAISRINRRRVSLAPLISRSHAPRTSLYQVARIPQLSPTLHTPPALHLQNTHTPPVANILISAQGSYRWRGNMILTKASWTLDPMDTFILSLRASVLLSGPRLPSAFSRILRGSREHRYVPGCPSGRCKCKAGSQGHKQ